MGAAFKLTDAIDDNIVKKLKIIGEQSEETAQSYAKLVVQMGEMTRLNPKGLDELQQKAAKYNDTAKELREAQAKLNKLQKEQAEIYKKVAKDIEAQIKAESAKAKLEGQMLANDQKRLRNQQLMEKQNRKRALSEEEITNALNTQAKSMQQASEQNRVLRQAMRETDLTASDSAEKMELYNRKIMENEELLDKNSDAMIQRKRNIGNYASAWNGLGASVQQVARELPSLTMGFNTFFLAISNNLPMLVDELKRASERVKELKEAGEEAEPVWKQLGKSIFSWQTALLVGITILSMYGSEIIEWTKSMFTAKDAVLDFEEAQDNVNLSLKESGTGVGEQIAKIKKLSEQWADLGGNLDAQKKFIVDNKDAFDELGVKVTNVEEAENLLVSNTEAFVQAMIQRAQASAGLKLASEQYEKALQKQMEIDEALKEGVTTGDKFKANVANFGLQQAGSSERVSAEDVFNERIAALQKEKEEIESLAFNYVNLSSAKDEDSKSTLENANIQLTQGTEGVKAAEDAAKRRLEIEKALRDSRIALLKDEEEREISLLRAEFADKIAEYQGQSEEEIEIRENLEKQLQEAIDKVRKSYQEKRVKEEADRLKKEADAAMKAIENTFANKSVNQNFTMNEELDKIADEYAKGLIDKEEYERKKAEITKKYEKEQILSAISMLEELLNIEGLGSEQLLKIREKLANKRIELSNWEREKVVKDKEQEEEVYKKQLDFMKTIFDELESAADEMVPGLGKIFDGVNNIFEKLANKQKVTFEDVLTSISAIAQGVSEIFGQIYQKQIEDLERQEEANEESREKELSRIEEMADKGAISEEEAEARKRAAEDRTAKKNEEIAKKKAALQTKQAKLEKSTNIAQTIMNTAVAVMKAWSQGGIFAAPMAAMIAAMGAIQLATIVAQPIPKYAKGTKDHKGGLAWVGDGGVSETIVTNKGMYLTPSTPTLVDLPRGAKVIPYAIDMEAMKMSAVNPELKVYSQNEKTPININNDYTGLQKDVRELKASQQKCFKQIAKIMKSNDYKRFAASV